jgi:hypothetical protein
MGSFIRRLGGGPSRRFYLYNRIIRAGNPDGAIVALHAAIVADFEAERTVAGRRLAGQNTLPAAVAPLFVHVVFVIVVHGIVRIHVSDHPAEKSVLGTDLA